MVSQIQTHPVTTEAFDAWVMLPENADKSYELIAGEIYEVVANWDSSKIAAIILGFIIFYVRQHGLGDVTGADGGYKVGKDRFIPDVGFVKKERLTNLPYEEGYYPIAPDLAVEVVSPTDTDKKLRRKITNYLQAGVTVWVVDPADQLVEIHAPGQFVEVIEKDGTIDGGQVLSGFSLKVSEFLA
ncbi:MAG TPA: Uma2 family endonuclease [Phototrophicaceae bacterium]|jgi:Uma2 family endonuclease|nr:Uma2 family endonuclease [Phototrophicaceae bacterium]